MTAAGISNPPSGVRCLDCGKPIPDAVVTDRREFFRRFAWIHRIGKSGWTCEGAVCKEPCLANRGRARKVIG